MPSDEIKQVLSVLAQVQTHLGQLPELIKELSALGT
jgi:hypothetical protein